MVRVLGGKLLSLPNSFDGKLVYLLLTQTATSLLLKQHLERWNYQQPYQCVIFVGKNAITWVTDDCLESDNAEGILVFEF